MNVLLLYSLLFLPSIMCKVRRTIKNVRRPFPGANWDRFAKTTIDVGDIKEATACWKYRTFSYKDKVTQGCPFNVLAPCSKDHCFGWVDFAWGYSFGWKTGNEAQNKQAGSAELYISQDNETRAEHAIQVAEKVRWHVFLFEEWQDLFEWQSVCYAISLPKKTELIFVNGKLTMGYKWTKEFSKGWGHNPIDLNIGWHMNGEVTDMNIYDYAFDDKEMIERTTSCEEPPKGQIFAWDPEKFDLVNDNDTETVISSVESEELCSKEGQHQDVLEVFDHDFKKSPLDSEKICARLNGQLNLVPTTEEKGIATVNEMANYAAKMNISGQLGLWMAGRAFVNGTEMMETENGYQTYPKGGRWTLKDPYTGDIIGVPFVTLPKGGTFSWVTQECISCFIHYEPWELASFGDKLCKGTADCRHNFRCDAQICDRGDIAWGLMCRFKQKLRLRLKGLCKSSKVDTDYLLLGYEVLDSGGGNPRKYGGSTGWLLAFDKDNDEWQLQHEHYPHLGLTMEEKDMLPVGVHWWRAGNNTCNLGQTSSVQLQLSACLSDQFTCRNGKCVGMESRCDNIEVDSLLHPLSPPL